MEWSLASVIASHLLQQGEKLPHMPPSSWMRFTDPGSPVLKLQVTHKHQKVDFKWPKQTSDPGLQVSSLPQRLVRCWVVWMSELSLQPQHTVGQDPRGAEPCYNSSWLAADGTGVAVGVLSVKSSLAYTHTPGTGLQEKTEDKKASAAQPVVPTTGKQHSPTAANQFNWVNQNMQAVARKSAEERSTGSVHIQAYCSQRGHGRGRNLAKNKAAASQLH